MITIRDKIALGTFAGFIGSIPGLLVNFLSYQLGHSNYYSFQLAGGVYLLKNLTGSLSGIILGGIAWESMAGFLGILLVYLIHFTGRDYWWLKGIVISNGIFYILIYGFFFSLGGGPVGPKVVPWDIKTNYTVLLENLIFGLTTSYLIIKWNHTLGTKVRELS